MLANVTVPETAFGMLLLVRVASPNWPLPFEPQQYATPAVVSPQV
jgi:hypothetical protein